MLELFAVYAVVAIAFAMFDRHEARGDWSFQSSAVMAIAWPVLLPAAIVMLLYMLATERDL